MELLNSWYSGRAASDRETVGFLTPVKLVTYYLFDIRGAKQSIPNK